LFKVHKAGVNLTKLPVILISNMAAHTDCFQI